MKYGETTKPNGLRSVERGPNIAKTLPLQSVGQSGGPTNRNHNKSTLGKLYYQGIDSAPLDLNLMTNLGAVRGVLPCEPCYNHIRVLRRPPIKATNAWQVPTGFARDQRTGAATQGPILKELPVSRGNFSME
tara:strand:+ start:184 stop:579 length:396 start_codon:yes stop_codon:yes gene_type:complete